MQGKRFPLVDARRPSDSLTLQPSKVRPLFPALQALKLAPFGTSIAQNINQLVFRIRASSELKWANRYQDW